MNRKIFILLPDGVGLRNFAFTRFYDIGISKDFDIVYWNNTVFDLSIMGFNEIRITHSKSHPITDIYKKAKVQVEINQSIKKTKDKVYKTYCFPFSYRDFKSTAKSSLVNLITFVNSSNIGLLKIRNRIKKEERKTLYYHQSLDTLKKNSPSIVFCTNQRHVATIAPILAAQDLGIPTATFIFSWDNLPKATMVVETDYYFVWSEYMKNELLFYYPFIKEEQIYITGTPQFEKHFDKSIVKEKNDFFKQYGLDIDKKYICFSGDDITTSPDDVQYLEDIAKGVLFLNSKGNKIGIIFRRCPVDFSNRYNSVLDKYSEIIVPIDPLWQQSGDSWSTVMPTLEDIELQINIIANSEFVINIASSMVFDFVAFKKPCLYINYDVENKKIKDWSTKKIYNFIHFRSMPTEDSVYWINNSNEIADTIEKMLRNDSQKVIKNAQKWFEKINQHPAELASSRIWEAIEEIIEN